MAFKLTKKEVETRDSLAGVLREKAEAFDQVKEEMAAGTSTLDDLNTALAEVVVAVGEAEDFRDDVANRLREEFDTKSEKWMESDKGSEVDEFISEWEGISFDTPDLDDPTELELEDYAEVLEGLPEEIQ